MQPGNRIYVRKEKGPAAQFIRVQPDKLWNEAAASPRGLLHARAATKGHESDNENNHPIAGLGWVVVHNGHVHNDDDLWGHYSTEAKRFAEVDTSAIPLILSQGTSYMDSLQHLTLIAGGATCALWSLKDPGKMALVRLGTNSLYMFLDDDILYWSSAPVAGRIMPGRVLGTVPFLSMAQLPDERVMILDLENPKMGTMFKVIRSPFFARRAASPTHHTQSAAIQIGTRVKETTRAGENEPRLKWERKDTKLDLGKRPTPQLPKPGRFAWNAHDYLGAVSEAKTTSKSIRLDTIYGRWILVNGSESVYRYFKPYKGQKKFIKRNWPGMSLPAAFINGHHVTEHDGKLPFEYITYYTTFATGSLCTEPGMVCPWCGIWARSSTWFEKYDRCPFCNIKSSRGVDISVV